MVRSFLIGPWTVQPDLNQISRNGETVRLEPKAMEVLLRLTEAPGETLSKDELIQSVWPDTFVSDDVLSKAVYELRRAFGDDPHEPRIIQTIPKRGYRLIAPLTKPQPLPSSILPLRRLAALASALVFLVLAGAALGYWWHRHNAPEVVIDSIAVLPFADMSPAKDQEYLSDGMTEELINTLAKIPNLQVTARTSSFQFKGKNEDLRKIGRDLNVRSVMEGSVRRDGRRVRIAVQLISVENGFHLWSESYDRDMSDVFTLQEEIARSATAALKVRFLPTAIPPTRSTSPEAYSAYLQGQFFAAQGSPESWKKARGYYEEAIKLDPAYGPTWVGLGSSYFQLGQILAEMPPDEGVRKAREAAEQALKLNPNLPGAYILLGDIKQWWDYDWAGADADYVRALELEPGNTLALARAAFLDASMGRCERALTRARRGVKLDPVNGTAQQYLAASARDCEQWDEAEAAARKQVELKGEAFGLLLVEILAERAKGREALAAAEQLRYPAGRALGFALAYQSLGEKEQSDLALQELVKKYGQLHDYQVATVYAFRGDADPAFQWLEHAYVTRSPGITCAKMDPLLKNLRGDPRWKPFMKKMKFPD